MTKVIQKNEEDKIVFNSESGNIKVELKNGGVDINEYSEVMLEIFAKLAIAKYDKTKFEKMLTEIKAAIN